MSTKSAQTENKSSIPEGFRKEMLSLSDEPEQKPDTTEVKAPEEVAVEPEKKPEEVKEVEVEKEKPAEAVVEEEKKPEEEERRPRRRAKGYDEVPNLMADLKEATNKMAQAAERIAPKEAPKKQEETFDYTEQEKKQLAVLEHMESIYPDKYKGISEKARKFVMGFDAEEARIRKDNPTISEDDLAEEMESYRSKVGAVWNDDDFIDARIDLRTKPLRDENEQLKTKLGKLTEKETQKELLPEAEKIASEVVLKDVIPALGNFGKLVNSKGEVIKEEADKLISDDPVIGEIVLNTIDQTKELSTACAVLFNGGKTELAQQVVQWALFTEDKIAKLPPDKRLDEEGRVFVPRAKWNTMSESERERHWVVGPEDIIPIIANSLSTGAKSRIQKIQDRDAKKYKPATPSKPVSPAVVESAPMEAPVQVAKGFLSEMRG